jgi:hypothetical protein
MVVATVQNNIIERRSKETQKKDRKKRKNKKS